MKATFLTGMEVIKLNDYFAVMNKSPLNAIIKQMLVLSVLLNSVITNAQNLLDRNDAYLKASNQVLLVTARDWNSIQGTMQLYERTGEGQPWKAVNKFEVTLGRTGLAFDGRSKLPKPAAAAVKHEGDGKSPAGIFKLGPVFSYHALEGLKMPFKKVDTSDICVDDINSAYYNTLVNTGATLKKDWNSFEHMRSTDGAYEYGVWLKYNSDTIFAGDGSCIFIHVWAGNKSPTAGCTAMDKQNILTLIHWLDEGKNPLLLQTVEKE